MKKILFSVLVLTFILPGVSFAASEDPVDASMMSGVKVIEPRLSTVKPT